MTAALAGIAAQVAAGRLIPYLGPDVLGLDEAPPVPTGARALSHLLASKVAVPGRIRNNLWHTAQYIETHRNRVTLDRLLADTFKTVPAPTPLHRWLAGLPRLPLIVDTWYDGAMAAALDGRDSWGLVQGVSKARRTGEAPWYRSHGPERPATLLYKPHGAAQPAGDVLASDADYVEVLCELDIQTPIPPEVQERRAGRGFLFLGCRFYDQVLRSFARAILKRSGGPHYAVVPGDELTRNEARFLAAENIVPIPAPLAEAVASLTAPPLSPCGRGLG